MVQTSAVERLYSSISIESQRDLYYAFRNKRLFITGGTGFIGKWIILTICRANDVLGTNIQITALSRSPKIFLENFPFFKTRPELSFISGDLGTFDFEEVNSSYIIHAASDTSSTLCKEQPHLVYGKAVEGAGRIAELARRVNAEKVLYTSSGAVYGEIPANLRFIPESYSSNSLPSIEVNAYRRAKMECEKILLQENVPSVIARCFAFVGPFIPLDQHYAVGNFINDTVHGREIVITGDGTSVRSYMYAGDLAVWLLTLLQKAPVQSVYNVGSSDSVSIKELAEIFAELFPKTKYKILNQHTSTMASNRYVPDTTAAETEFGLRSEVTLREAILKTEEYFRSA